MPIFNKNNKRVYLRKKSHRLHNFAVGGIFFMIVVLAIN